MAVFHVFLSVPFVFIQCLSIHSIGHSLQEQFPQSLKHTKASSKEPLSIMSYAQS